jgi:hypothetical protein
MKTSHFLSFNNNFQTIKPVPTTWRYLAVKLI